MRVKEIEIKDYNCLVCNDEINVILKNNKISSKKISGNKILFSSDDDGRLNRTEIEILKVLKNHGHSYKTDEYVSYNFSLRNVSCPSCSRKIKRDLLKDDNILECEMLLETQTLKLKLKEKENEKQLVKKVNNIIKNYITNGSIVVEKKRNFVKDNWLLITRIILSTILLLIGAFVFEDKTYKLVTFIISYLIISYDIIYRAFKVLFTKFSFNEHFLMMVASIGAFIINESTDAVLVMLLYQVGELLKNLSVSRSTKSIQGLLAFTEKEVNVIVNDEVVRMDTSDVKIDSIVLIKTGEKILLDGVVVDGEGYLNTKMITGESKPLQAAKGNEVISGYILESGTLKIKTTSTASDSKINKIIAFLEEAKENKSETEIRVSKMAKYYTPIILLLAILIFIIPVSILGFTTTSLETWGYRALIFLVISCPCSIVISIPLAYFLSVGSASQKGILIKSGNSLDILDHIKTVYLDKTGTMTQGVLRISKVKTVNYDEDQFLELVALSEIKSHHPIAKSIVSEYRDKLDTFRVKEFKEIKGQGIKAIVDDKKIAIGSYNFLKAEGIKLEEVETTGSIIYVSINGRYSGYIVIQDQLRKDAKDLIGFFKKQKIKTHLLTGDNEIEAKKITDVLEIDDYDHSLLPLDKAEIIKQDPNKTLFLGEGINDAPSLEVSDLGVSLGSSASDLAIESADVVIVDDNLSGIRSLFKLAKKNKSIVNQNLILSFGSKIVLLVASALGFTPMWLAIVAHLGITLLCILNSTRMLSKRTFS
ncbi:MAG TPA: cadmium-translocating P-type ATPase [Acholeplasma sp.]|nr:cadmium-translocating P-type ATPase [Acholeplasma sp.]